MQWGTAPCQEKPHGHQWVSGTTSTAGWHKASDRHADPQAPQDSARRHRITSPLLPDVHLAHSTLRTCSKGKTPQDRASFTSYEEHSLSALQGGILVWIPQRGTPEDTPVGMLPCQQHPSLSWLTVVTMSDGSISGLSASHCPNPPTKGERWVQSEGTPSLQCRDALRSLWDRGQSRLEQPRATPGAEPAWGSWQPAAASPARGCLLAHVDVHSCRRAWPATTAWPPCSSTSDCSRLRSIPLPQERQIPPLGSARAPGDPAQTGEALRSHPKLLAFSFYVGFSWPETELLLLRDSSFCSSCHLYVCVFPLPP